MDMLFKILGSGAVSAILLAALGVMCRNWFLERLKSSIQHEYDERLEKLKAQLSRENEKELTEFKHKLELAAAERNFKFTKVFEQTAQTIAEIYKKLQIFKQASDNFAIVSTIVRDQNERNKELQVVYGRRDEFYSYFTLHKLYVPKNTSIKIQEVFGKFNNVVHGNYITSKMTHEETVSNEVFHERHMRLLKESDEALTLLAALEDDFQKILGFQSEAKLAELGGS